MSSQEHVGAVGVQPTLGERTPPASPTANLRSMVVIIGYGLREALRRRVFVVVVTLSVAFLALYGVGAWKAFGAANNPDIVPDAARNAIDVHGYVGATIFGLAMFATMFLGAILAVFLTLGTVRGDAERGLLQPLVVRPVGRASLLVARFIGALLVTTLYVTVVYTAALLITHIAGGSWWPDRIVLPGLALVGAVGIVVAVSLLGSVLLSATANGIAVLMVVGAGLTAGLLGQIGQGLQSATLKTLSDIGSWVLPFEALYEGGLHDVVANTGGLAGVILRLGPFGGAHGASALLVAWAIVYVLGVIAVAVIAFARRDL